MKIKMGEVYKEGFTNYRVVWNGEIDRELKIKLLRSGGSEFVQNSLKYWDSLPADVQKKLIRTLNEYLEIDYVRTDG
jgi:hypothetical protein